MKRLFVLAITVLGIGSLAQADIYCGVTKHDGDVELWRDNSNVFVTGNKLYD